MFQDSDTLHCHSSAAAKGVPFGALYFALSSPCLANNDTGNAWHSNMSGWWILPKRSSFRGCVLNPVTAREFVDCSAAHTGLTVLIPLSNQLDLPNSIYQRLWLRHRAAWISPRMPFADQHVISSTPTSSQVLPSYSTRLKSHASVTGTRASNHGS